MRDVVIRHVVTPPCQISIPGQLRPLTTPFAIPIEVVILPHIVVILRQHGRGEVVELPRKIDIIENEVFQTAPASADSAHKGDEVSIGLMRAVLFLNSAGSARSTIEHLVKSAIVIDPLLTAQKTLINLLGISGHAKESPVLLDSRQETLRSRRTGEIINIVAEWLTHVGLVRPCSVQVEFFDPHSVRIIIDPKMMPRIKIELVALLRQSR